ncbi:Alpha/beta hydrolase fold-1 [Lasiodiplodia theobromae]|uniref:Putative epoxide hydrolase n=1 Tax=Lasiodiplodia theobromae TaxID=45133 RepID=A0A5N5DMD3_9PEZI|nr:Alpha beta hydrolase fold protein [Lasiodiplodia theobromae]KAB2579075.1 putative epoxide hydrolase [Lasiodiplodia theobromae]KAF4544684.1 Alpha beta hydrolase fold protein [Lasiodiplodia theobromae]KAF9637943.1 Alpha/beta hydrolase fold-1 [Lasiodiplodia theobromae]
MSPPLFARPPFPVSPNGALSQFKIDVSEDEVQKLKTLLKLLPIPRPNWENGHNDQTFGTPRDWLVESVNYWQNKYDWRKQEEILNSIPQFKVEVQDDDGQQYSVHFAALFSENKDAIPIHLSHGWPGSFIEFLPILLKLKEKYASAPEKLPYHVIVPSIIGFGFSSPPPLNKGFTIRDNCRIFHKAMVALGFGDRGYITQGGDLGGPIAETLAAVYEPVKAAHVNIYYVRSEGGAPGSLEQEAFERQQAFMRTGMAYGLLHATRPSTAGLTIGNSPISLLAWIGEKMLEWSDPAHVPSLDTILTNVAIYWFTGTFPTSIWCYRPLLSGTAEATGEAITNGKPKGFSWFPHEIAALSKDFIRTDKHLTHIYENDEGGHFAALEVPDLLWADIEDFVSKVWKQ